MLHLPVPGTRFVGVFYTDPMLVRYEVSCKKTLAEIRVRLLMSIYIKYILYTSKYIVNTRYDNGPRQKLQRFANSSSSVLEGIRHSVYPRVTWLYSRKPPTLSRIEKNPATRYTHTCPHLHRNSLLSPTG